MTYKINQNITDFNYCFFEEVMITNGYVYVKLRNEIPAPSNWVAITNEEFNLIKESILTPSE